MPIIFVSLNNAFIEKAKQHGFEGKSIRIEDFKPTKRTYYVSPANSLCFMDGGIDLALSRIIFPDIEKQVKATVRQLGIKNILGRSYLPIGSSIIFGSNSKFLVVAPTMLLPQNVANTENAYYATMAVLYNVLINRKEKLDEVDIILTSMCCGYGKMNEETSIQQILKAIRDYPNYAPQIINKDIIVKEPNLAQQPKYYENTEFFQIKVSEIERV